MSSDGVEIEKRKVHLLAWAPWVVIAAGVLIMVVLFVVAVITLTGHERENGSGDPPVRPAVVPVPTDPDSPLAETSASPTGSPSASASALPSGTSAAPRPTSSFVIIAPRRATLTGTYRVRGGGTSYVGELRIDNASGTAQNWTATLSFPDDAGDLRSYWVEGGPKAAMTQSGNRYVFTGGAPVPAGATITLNLQFRKAVGTTQPTECSVSGTACTIG